MWYRINEQGVLVDQNGNPAPPAFQAARANFQMAQNVAQMGLSPDHRGDVWPTRPMLPNDPGVIAFVRFYSVELTHTESDYAVGTATTRIVNFSEPAIILAANGSSITNDGSAMPVGLDARDTFQIKLVANKENIILDSRLGSTILGTAQRPGFLAGGGWVMSRGSALEAILTPRLTVAGSGLRINVVFMCLEVRSGSSWVR